MIAAEGEHKASRALRMAAEVIMDSPAALQVPSHLLLLTSSFSAQLRYLQTLNSIAAENNSTIIFPIPIDIVAHFMGGENPKHQLLPPAPTHQVSWITFGCFHHFIFSCRQQALCEQMIPCR